MTVRPARSWRCSSGPTRRLAVLTLAVTTMVGIAGCAGVHPNAAAVVDGTTISEQDLDAVAADLGPFLQPGQSLPRQNVLTALIMQPFIADQLKSSNKMVSLDQAARALHQVAAGADTADDNAPGPDQWSTSTKALAQAQVGIGSLTPGDQERVLGAIAKAQVEVNPKYGSFQLPGQVVPTVENWIDAKGAGAPGAQNQAPQPMK